MRKALEIKNLTKIYPNGTKALNGISFNVEEGAFFALLGPNGAGKSTTIGIITNLIPKTSGEVYVFGETTETNIERVKSYIGVVPQEFNFNQFETVQNIVYAQAGYYGISRRQAKEAVEKYLKQLGLWEKRRTSARALSGGMKRRLMIARALVHEPKLLILDEPTAGVDIEIRRSIWDFLISLNKSGKTIILTTHYLEEAERLCRDIVIIDKGSIIRNTSMNELLKESSSRTFIFDLENELTLPLYIDGFEIRQLDPLTLEVITKDNNALSILFAYFAQHNIVIKDMRNQSNKLETLFIKLTKEAQS